MNAITNNIHDATDVHRKRRNITVDFLPCTDGGGVETAPSGNARNFGLGICYCCLNVHPYMRDTCLRRLGLLLSANCDHLVVICPSFPGYACIACFDVRDGKMGHRATSEK